MKAPSISLEARDKLDGNISYLLKIAMAILKNYQNLP